MMVMDCRLLGQANSLMRFRGAGRYTPYRSIEDSPRTYQAAQHCQKNLKGSSDPLATEPAVSVARQSLRRASGGGGLRCEACSEEHGPPLEPFDTELSAKRDEREQLSAPAATVDQLTKPVRKRSKAHLAFVASQPSSFARQVLATRTT